MIGLKIERAKKELREEVQRIGTKHNLPAYVMELILDKILSEIKDIKMLEIIIKEEDDNGN